MSNEFNIPKFRAWHIAAKKMYEVIGLEFDYKEVFITRGLGEAPDLFFGFKDIILMQSTGLKDEKGVEIFAGDILEIADCGTVVFYRVEWCGDRGYPAFELDPPLCTDMNGLSYISQDGNYDYKVIGNIHENPELLQGDRE